MTDDNYGCKQGRLFIKQCPGLEVIGHSFGASRNVSGEVVFNTGMVGYPEALSDPSYRGQILVLTFPLVGNYGVPDQTVKNSLGLSKYFESDSVHISGLIVSEYCEKFSHWNAVESLGKFLKRHNIPALYGIDTRMLTKIIRENGSLLGTISFESNCYNSISFEDPNQRNLVAEVSNPMVRVFNKDGSPRILAVDCGMKANIVKLLAKDGAQITVVPYNFDILNALDNFDGLFLSNGPGDPCKLDGLIQNVRMILKREPPKPVFGICLGNQIIALAAGCKTYKMLYGNRGMNQPCIDLRTTNCLITAQNHGFAVDDETLPPDWNTFFMNANDLSNEGLIHTSKPFFSVQFHPEARGGPLDTTYLFDMFFEMVTKKVKNDLLVPPHAYKIQAVNKCLLVGSGGLSIGQAGEFDYSGSQAIKALKEEGIQVILINPNIATVQTHPGFADKVYFLPVTPEMVLDVIKKERPDSILISMGGQTALNVGINLWRRGIFKEYEVRVLGTPIQTIIDTEDRELFGKRLAEISEATAKSLPATSIEEAVAAANEIGYPILVRAAFTLGGLGSGFVSSESQLRLLASKAFKNCKQILIDEDLRGWKEVEYEVVRDNKDNCITVCNMENFDPLGIHTGDSIVIAPSLTLSNEEYFMLRNVSIKVVRYLGIIGECNIQFALHPKSLRYCIIEVNARLSRSSALASKATGYPLAYVAAKLCLGKDLVILRNHVTKKTSACFEPSLDYIVCKVPRWDLHKFNFVSNKLDSSMKSVGEAMSIGKTFEEVIQKGLRMVSQDGIGYDSTPLDKRSVDFDGTEEQLNGLLVTPTPIRVYAIARAFENGYSVDKIHELTKIDKFFLSKLQGLTFLKKETIKLCSASTVSPRHLLRLKKYGFSDLHIANLCKVNESEIRCLRRENSIYPYVKQIDTLAAEFPAQTNYLYMTYNATEHDLSFEDNGVIVLGNGAYCIGSSVEFDWCAVSCLRTLRKNDISSVMINFNPETVSTDYDESDRLYFEELSVERILDIYYIEQSVGVIVSVGGQIANNAVMDLANNDVRILGTSARSIDCAEDRNKFSKLCDLLNVDQPEWIQSSGIEQAKNFAEKVGYPVLVRPSYVLSGAAMRVATNNNELSRFLNNAAEVSEKYPVVVTKFIVDAKEVELDAVSKDGDILNFAISEHIENAGVHSGDATLVLPAQRLYIKTIREIKRIAGNISKKLNINGPFNMQFICKDNDVKVIECNLRASRTFPFVSKTFNSNFISLATKVMVGLDVSPYTIKLLDLDYCGIKAPMFSFNRLIGADPTLGVEMSSTGEVACFGETQNQAFLLALMSSGFKIKEYMTVDNLLPYLSHKDFELLKENCKGQKIKSILVTLNSQKNIVRFLDLLPLLSDMNYVLFATDTTTEALRQTGYKNVFNILKYTEVLEKRKSGIDVSKLLASDILEFAINVPDSHNTPAITDEYRMRRNAVDFNVPLFTNLSSAVELIKALNSITVIPCLSMDDVYKLGQKSKQWTKPKSKPFHWLSNRTMSIKKLSVDEEQFEEYVEALNMIPERKKRSTSFLSTTPMIINPK